METQRIQNNLNRYLARTAERKLEQLGAVSWGPSWEGWFYAPSSGKMADFPEPVQGPQDQHRLHSNTMVLPTFPVLCGCNDGWDSCKYRANRYRANRQDFPPIPNRELREEGERQESCDSTEDTVKTVVCMLTPLRLAWDAWYQKRTWSSCAKHGHTWSAGYTGCRLTVTVLL